MVDDVVVVEGAMVMMENHGGLGWRVLCRHSVWEDPQLYSCTVPGTVNAASKCSACQSIRVDLAQGRFANDIARPADGARQTFRLRPFSSPNCLSTGPIIADSISIQHQQNNPGPDLITTPSATHFQVLILLVLSWTVS